MDHDTAVSGADTARHTSGPSVGWVGLGDQGLPMATAIAEAGFTLHVWARRSASLDALVGVPHVAHHDLESLAAASDIVGLCVGTDDDVMNLLTGGLLAGVRPGSVVVNHGTGTPASCARFVEACEAVDVVMLDAPVSGGRPAAVERRLTTMVGGPEDAVTRCTPVFETFSTHVVHLGDVGSGQWAKLFNNALMILNQASIADVFELAVRVGMDVAQLREVLMVSSAGSTVLGLFTTMINPETVEHLSKLESLDIELFDDALRASGIDASDVTTRALSGAERIPAVVERLVR